MDQLPGCGAQRPPLKQGEGEWCVVWGNVQLQRGMYADQQVDWLDGQLLQPHRMDQRLHWLKHLQEMYYFSIHTREQRSIIQPYLYVNENIMLWMLHLFREGGDWCWLSAPLCCGCSWGHGTVRNVGVEQSFNVVNKSVFKVDSGRMELEGNLRIEHTKSSLRGFCHEKKCQNLLLNYQRVRLWCHKFKNPPLYFILSINSNEQNFKL